MKRTLAMHCHLTKRLVTKSNRDKCIFIPFSMVQTAVERIWAITWCSDTDIQVQYDPERKKCFWDSECS